MSTTTVPVYKKLSFNLFNIGVIILALYLAQDILIPIFIAILLATLLLPVVHLFERFKLGRFFSIFFTLIIALVVIGSIVYFLSAQIANFFDDIESIKERLTNLIGSLKEWIHNNFNVAIRKQNQYIKETTTNMQSGSSVGVVGKTFISLTGALAYIVILPLYTFLILYYRQLIKKFLIHVFKKTEEDQVTDILHESQVVSQQYILGLMTELVIVFVLNSTGFLILGIKYAFFLGLVAALLNLIPYIGMLVANVFCMLITLITSENVSDVLWVGLILAVVQIVDNNILMPMIVGSRVKINALAAIVGVFFGGAICGISGMFLSIPGLAILKVIFDRVDGLKPYGLILGDDSEPPTKKTSASKK